MSNAQYYTLPDELLSALRGAAASEYERGFAAGVEAAARIADRNDMSAWGIAREIRALAPDAQPRGEGARCGSGAWATCPKGHTNFLKPGDYCPDCQPAPVYHRPVYNHVTGQKEVWNETMNRGEPCEHDFRAEESDGSIECVRCGKAGT